jgi:hypothetical protein
MSICNQETLRFIPHYPHLVVVLSLALPKRGVQAYSIGTCLHFFRNKRVGNDLLHWLQGSSFYRLMYICSRIFIHNLLVTNGCSGGTRPTSSIVSHNWTHLALVRCGRWSFNSFYEGGLNRLGLLFLAKHMRCDATAICLVRVNATHLVIIAIHWAKFCSIFLLDTETVLMLAWLLLEGRTFQKVGMGTHMLFRLLLCVLLWL